MFDTWHSRDVIAKFAVVLNRIWVDLKRRREQKGEHSLVRPYYFKNSCLFIYAFFIEGNYTSVSVNCFPSRPSFRRFIIFTITIA